MIKELLPNKNKVCVLSIDPGIKNMAFMYYSSELCTEDNFKVKLELVDLGKKKDSCQKIGKRLIEYLNNLEKRFNMSYNETIIISEQQCFIKLKYINGVLLGYFKDKIKFISPKTRNKFYGLDNLGYKERKKRSVALFTENCNTTVNVKKMDDIADTFLQLKYYLSPNGGGPK